MVAFVGLRDQLVDFARGDLRQNAVAFADGQQDRVQHLVHALDQSRGQAVEQGCLAALSLRRPSFDASTRRMISFEQRIAVASAGQPAY